MPILEATGDISATMRSFLVTSGTLAQRRRRCEDSHFISRVDMQELLAHLARALGVIFLATERDDLHGFAAAAVIAEPAPRAGRQYFSSYGPDRRRGWQY